VVLCHEAAALPAPPSSPHDDIISGFGAALSGSSRSRPRIFIGSSSEGSDVVLAIEHNLLEPSIPNAGHRYDIEPWYDGLFGLGEHAFQSLIDRLKQFDFAILVLTPDDVSLSRESERRVPRDNVLLELGLFVGAIGLNRTFIVRERSIALPSDLLGTNCVEFETNTTEIPTKDLRLATTKIDNTMRKIGARDISDETPMLFRRGEFALCIPRDASDADEFNRELKHYLMERLLDEDMRMLDCSSFIHPAPHRERTLWDFRRKLDSLRQPDYLLIIWPGIVIDDDPDSVLSSLKRLITRGCRIAALNEFPKKGLSDSALFGKLFLITANAKKGFELLCGYIKNQITGDSRVLLVNASQQFQSAVKRKELYQQQLNEYHLRHDSLSIESWDYDECRATVLNELQKRHDVWPYGVIAAANDNMAMGAADALDEYCDRHKVSGKSMVLETKVVGYDGLPSAIARIRKPDNRFVATLAASPRSIVNTAFRVLCKDHQAAGAEVEIPIRDEDLKTRESLGTAMRLFA